MKEGKTERKKKGELKEERVKRKEYRKIRKEE
jgi:hypothetical protein